MKRNVLDTSIEAYYSMPNKKKAAQSARIETIVRFLCADTPGADCSLREIKHWYDKRFASEHGEIDVSTVSARINELVAAGRIERPGHVRKCSKSLKPVHPVKPPQAQRQLFGAAA